MSSENTLRPAGPSIASIVTAGLVAAATLLVVLIGVIGYSAFWRHQQGEFKWEQSMLADELAASLSLPLWNFDRPQIDRVLDAAMRDTDLAAVLVRSAGPRPVEVSRSRDARWRAKAEKATPADSGLMIEERNVVDGDEVIGSVRLVITKEFLDGRLRWAQIFIGATIAALDLVLVVSLYLLLRQTVLRPIQELERYALTVIEGAPHAGLFQRAYRGELESLRRSLEKMIGLIEDRYAALRESEEKFAKAFRSGPDAMGISELDTGRFLEVNEGFERLFCYSMAEAVGRTAVDLGIWRDPEVRERFVRVIKEDGALRNIEIRVIDRKGEEILALLSAETLTLEGRTCVISVFHDITGRKRAEDRERLARDGFTARLIASQESERRRIAGELHDSLGQNLLLIKNRAQIALTGSVVPPELKWQFEAIQEMSALALAEVRQISHDLRPYQLDRLGLTRALEAMIDTATRNTGVSFTRKIDDVDDALAPEAATHVYRIAQEIVNNILKHSRATSAQVTIERDVHDVRLWAEDNGCGFTVGPAGLGLPEGGLGLSSIAERTRILGGSVKIDSAPGAGTRVEVIIPLPAQPDHSPAAGR